MYASIGLTVTWSDFGSMLKVKLINTIQQGFIELFLEC